MVKQEEQFLGAVTAHQLISEYPEFNGVLPSDSFTAEYLSDEDFLQQLSSDLDIPLLLNPGKDEMTMLNTFFDKSPSDILSETAIIRASGEQSRMSSPSSNSDSGCEVLSPVSHNSYPMLDVTTTQQLNGTHNIETQYQQRPIQPKFTHNGHNMMKLPSEKNASIQPPANIVIIPSVVRTNNTRATIDKMDPKLLKKHLRKIKNRESACLSRKKRKDYVASLETQIHTLQLEKEHLMQENAELRNRLSQYELVDTNNNSRSMYNSKNGFILCLFVFGLTFNSSFFARFNTNKSRDMQMSTSLDTLSEPTSSLALGHRSLLWIPPDSAEDSDTLNTTICPLTPTFNTVNQTETARLVSELERWIGAPPVLPTKENAIVKRNAAIWNKWPSRRPLGRRINSNTVDDTPATLTKVPQSSRALEVYSAPVVRTEPQPAQPAIPFYTDLYHEINRQSDTFYVVAFSEEHLLLPALEFNKTSRPKMSLIIPTVVSATNSSSSQNKNGSANASGKNKYVEFMQIDCEVLDTRLIKINYGSIPSHWRYGMLANNSRTARKRRPMRTHQTVN